MNTTSLLLVPLVSAGLLASVPTPPGDASADLRSFLEQLDATPDAPAAQAPAGSVRQGLTTGALQAASGLHSGARGLTAKEDWQRLFPRYSKRD